jgi:hypothetical protein
MTNTIKLLEDIRTELDCGQIANARAALSKYWDWARANMANTTRANDNCAIELSREIHTHQIPIPALDILTASVTE